MMQQLCSSYAFNDQPEQEGGGEGGGEGATVEGALEKAWFFPPLWNQRFASVAAILHHFKARRVLDLGCGEGKLAAYLKHNPLIEHLRGVDIDEAALLLASSLSLPLPGDFLFPRPSPFSLSFFRGDLLSPHPSLLSFDAVVCIEVMEHLEKEKLGRLEEVVFGYVKPALAIFSTPNVEFNVLFALPPSRLRHFDHKFEFTRSEFAKWAEGVSERFGYSVELCGVGDPPPPHSSLGHCSQLAIFFLPPNTNADRIDDFTHHLIAGSCTDPMMMVMVDSPHDDDDDGDGGDGCSGVGGYKRIGEIEYPVVKREIRKEQVEWELEHYYRKHCERFDWPLNKEVKIDELLAYESELFQRCFGGDVAKAAAAIASSSLFSLSSDHSSLAGSPSYYLLSLRSGHDLFDSDDDYDDDDCDNNNDCGDDDGDDGDNDENGGEDGSGDGEGGGVSFHA